MNKGIWAKIRALGTEVIGNQVTGTPEGDKHLLDVAIGKSISLGFSPSGLSIGGKVTEVTLSSTVWTALPATALTSRNGMGIQNESAVSIKVGFDPGETGFVGWTVLPNGEFFIDVSDVVVVYAKAQSGTPTVTIMEVA